MVRKLKNFLGKTLLSLAANGIALRSGDRQLNELAGCHDGKKAVIIGMGPSLKPEDLERLGDAVTFACNKIFLLFPTTQWRPDYYSVCDVLVSENNRDQILEADFGDAKVIHSANCRNDLEVGAGELFYRYRDSFERGLAEEDYSLTNNLGGGILAGGSSVIVDQIQMAYAMGFREVYVVGIDFSFKVPSAEPQKMSVSGAVLESESEVNHFHPDYRKLGETWTVPKLNEMEEAFLYCRKVFEADGRKLINASRTSKLEVLERVPFDDVFPL